jgi:hypothetical protein
MTGHTKLRILLGAGLGLAALCTLVGLRVMRSIGTSPKSSEPVASLAPPVEVEPVLAATPPHGVRMATSSEHLKPQPDTGKQHKKVVVERILSHEDFKRLPVTLGYDHHGGNIYTKWGGDFVIIDKQDLELGGSFERALGRAPGIVFRQTDPP